MIEETFPMIEEKKESLKLEEKEKFKAWRQSSL